MSLRLAISATLFLSLSFLSAGQYFPRATATYSNSTSTDESPSYTTPPTCCWLNSFGVARLEWYDHSVEVTVATVFTNITKYDNTAITSYSTRYVNISNIIPTSAVNFQDIANNTVLNVVPTDLIVGGGGYDPEDLADTSFIIGTAFTDPYGDVFHSPTPVWIFSDVTLATAPASLTTGTLTTGLYYTCREDGGPFADQVAEMYPIYPSGFFMAAPTSGTSAMYGAEIITGLPTELVQWIAAHVPPSTSSVWSSVASCSPGMGDGIPYAHVPVATLTVNAPPDVNVIAGNFGSAATTPTTLSTSTAQPTLSSPGYHVTQTSALYIPITTPTTPTTPILTTTPTASPTASPTTTTNQAPITQPPVPIVAPVFTDGSSTYTADSQTHFVIGGSTLTPGGTVIIPGSGSNNPTTYALPTTGTAIIINGATQGLTSQTVTYAAIPTTPFIIIGSSTYTANSATAFVVGGQTLTAGGAITVSGETISLESGGSTVVVASGTGTSTEGLGGVIASIGGFGTATPTYVQVSGVDSGRLSVESWILGGMLLGALVIMCWL